ncbi:MAG TPA: DUF2784 domain-containing protein [Gammaproteobacteria bacterium]|nr:DUF2784 domain-containing protein [Gammaproteobacteria bacterium]
MPYHSLADAVAVVHLAFVVFAVAGGLLVLRWRRLVWLHLPAVIWAALVEVEGWICPLTRLQYALRERAGEAAWHNDFVSHFLLPVLYPTGLTRHLQLWLAALVVALNLAIYLWIWRRRRR